MISLIVAVAFTAWVLCSYIRYPAFFLAAIFLSWQFALKVAGTVFLDLQGPIYSDEVYTEVGGIGSSTPIMVLFVAIPLYLLRIAMTVFPKPPRPAEERYLAQGGFTQADLIFTGLVALMVCLYVDMARLGGIPLFSGLERFEYKGGVFHRLTLSFLFLVSAAMGYAVARTRLLTGHWDTRFAVVLLGLFIYLLLAGHRFGSFYLMLSFMLLPMAALWVAPQVGVLAPAPIPGLLQRVLTSRLTLLIFSSVLAGVVLAAVANSLLNVRDGDPGEALLQRFLVQPVHLYWLSWERWQAGEIEGVSSALDFMFRDPFDIARNTGIQYLMFVHLGQDTALRVFEDQSVDYAGGYPEILMEVGGLGVGAVTAVAAAAVTALLYRIHVLAIVRGHLLTALMSVYVGFGVINLFLGGMLNFLTVGSYWLKIGMLAFVMLLEISLERSGRRLLPWVLIGRKPAPADAAPPGLPAPVQNH
jgi:hypothetical protein